MEKFLKWSDADRQTMEQLPPAKRHSSQSEKKGQSSLMIPELTN
jgi:hypothetical protein